jgi:hypothetical protein
MLAHCHCDFLAGAEWLYVWYFGLRPDQNLARVRVCADLRVSVNVLQVPPAHRNKLRSEVVLESTQELMFLSRDMETGVDFVWNFEAERVGKLADWSLV